MELVRCPKCSSENADGAWICVRCEWILDPAVLMSGADKAGGVAIVDASSGEDIDDDELGSRTMPVVWAPELPPARGSAEPANPLDPDSFDVDVADLLGGDAVILGRLDDGDTEALLTDRTASFLVPGPAPVAAGPVTAPVYISNELARLLGPLAVPRRAPDAPTRRGFLPPFEGMTFDLVDGVRTVTDLRGETGLSDNDMRVVLALLLEKAMIDFAPSGPADSASAHDDRTIALPLEQDLDDHTRELDDLPPLSDERAPLPAGERQGEQPAPQPTPAAASLPYDELVMVPLPAYDTLAPPAPPPAEQEPPHVWLRNASSASPTPDSGAFQIPPSNIVEVARPPMRVEPLRPKPRNTPSPPSHKRDQQELAPRPAYQARAGLTLSRAGGGPPLPPNAKAAAEPLAPSAEAKKRAASFYELCMKDLHEGRAGRAWGYAKMAADADPTDEKYRLLVQDWGKMVGTAKPAIAGYHQAAASLKDLLEASQAAEQQGDYEAAVAHARKLCEAAPESGAAFNRLSVLLATRLKDFKGAYDAATTAVELEGSNLTFQSNMMKILSKLDTDERKASGGGKGGMMGKLLGK